jgi:hypothetical protein
VKASRYIFLIAGMYGILVTLPLFFMEQRLNAEYPPAITHPEYFYSFAGVTLVFQFLFFFIAFDPARYRNLMLLSVVEKLSLVPAFLILFPSGKFPLMMILPFAIDLVLGVLFAVSYTITGKKPVA